MERDVKAVIEDLLKIQKRNVGDDYMAGMYNGMVVVYNSLKELNLIDAKRVKSLLVKDLKTKKWKV